MKKRKFAIAGLSSLLIFGSVATMTACGPSKTMPVEVVTLEKIELDSSSAKTQYYEGDSFDRTGLLVKAFFSDGGESFVGNYSVSPDGALALTDTKVTISYTFEEVTKTAELPITVAKVEETGIRLDGVGSGRRKTPIKTEYKVGETFDKTTMTVYLTHNNGKETVVDADQYTYSPAGALALTDTKITVTYKTWTAEVKITVTEA
ncbi:MAG: bacterial Ig-like domain-containing protein [Bacilli bacterium]|nr:bacterial Ig-like domain-containing protein [Bacilli bacterium]